MLERYDDYFKKAKLFTSIHAKTEQKIMKPITVDAGESKENLDVDINNTTNSTAQPAQKIETAPLKKKTNTNTKRGAKRL